LWAGKPLGNPPLHLPIADKRIISIDNMWQLCKEFFLFLRQEKKWWLIPLLVILALLGALLVLSTNPALAPFMYPFL
jgi:hypothetical protein